MRRYSLMTHDVLGMFRLEFKLWALILNKLRVRVKNI